MSLFPKILGLLALAISVQSLPTTTTHHLAARRLLGSSFGVPGDDTFDYVVVGGGTAGLTVAVRLAEDPSNRVAVIEAGSFYELSNGNLSQVPNTDVYFAGKNITDTNPLVDWGFVTTPQAGADGAATHYARGKCLGGSSARNYMTYHLGTTGSYQKWADAVGDQSYALENFLPYFTKSQNFTPPNQDTRMANATPVYDASTLGQGGPLSVTFPNFAQPWATWAAKGMSAIGMKPIDGFSSGKLIGQAYSLNTIDATMQTRDSSETAFLQPALTEKHNLMVYQSTLAKKILFNADKVAVGVQVDSDGMSYTLSAKKEVVVSAGAFHSPQLLMVSGVGPAATLQKHNIPVVADRPGVGQNMEDHILFGPSHRVNIITSSATAIQSFYDEAVQEFNASPPKGILTNPGTDVIGWEKIPEPMRANFSANVTAQLSAYPADWPEVEYLNTAGYFGDGYNFITGGPNDGNNYATVAVALVAPLSRGTVDISSADTSDLPIIDPNWLTSPADVAIALAAFKRAREMLRSPAMAPVLIGPEHYPGPDVQTDAEILASIRGSFNTVFHAACTCAMGPANSTNAVIDAQAKVIGVSNLRVVDASSLPFLPPGHPMSTIYALAEKIADDMKGVKLSMTRS